MQVLHADRPWRAAHHPGEVVAKGPSLILSATAVELLDSVVEVTEPLSYFPWRDYSTAGSWVRWRTVQR